MHPPATEALQRSIAQVLERWPAVRSAWLFGSCAQGTAGLLSDVDIAILGGADLTFDERGRLTAEVQAATGRPCDVVVVEQASPVLGREIVETGVRFLCHDPNAADAWEDFAIRRYLGTAHLRKLVYDEVRTDLAGSRR